MCALSNQIRERPNWWEEVKDKAIVERWRKEILQQQGESGEAASKRLTPAMVLKSRYLRTISPVLTLISRLITCSRSSMDTHLCVTQ